MIAPKTSYRRAPLSRRMLLLTLQPLGHRRRPGALSASRLAQQAKGPSEVSVEELMKPVGLPDMALGPADSKVTIVEYASMTCGHCAHFTNDVWPSSKRSTSTPTRSLSFSASSRSTTSRRRFDAARCTGNDKAFPLIEVLFEKQKDWAFGEGNPVPRLFEIAKQAGFTQDFRQVPDRSEAARRDHRRPHARLRRARRVGNADLLHQRQEARRLADA